MIGRCPTDVECPIEDANMKSFCENYTLKRLIKQPTCYENRNKTTCIDLILTNYPCVFQSTCVIETGLSYFHPMTVRVVRKTFKKIRPRVITYRSYRDLSNETFEVSLINKFQTRFLSTIMMG